jgi:acyl-CoA thioester hydrolase
VPDYRFFHPVEIRYGDLDPQGHVNNAKHLTFFEQARVQYFVKLGLWSEDQSFMDIGVILADARHVPPADSLWAAAESGRAVKLGNKSITIAQNIMDTGSGDVLATGGVVMVAYDYRKKQTVPVPTDWREKIRAFEGLAD